MKIIATKNSKWSFKTENIYEFKSGNTYDLEDSRAKQLIDNNYAEVSCFENKMMSFNYENPEKIIKKRGRPKSK